MRVKAGLFNALFSTFSLIVCAQPGLHAQAFKPAVPVAARSRDSVQELLAVVGGSTLIDCAHPVERVTVGLGGFAEATAISRTEILVNGKAPGVTTLIIWETDGERQIFNVTVRASAYEADDRLAGIRREFEKDLPGQALIVRSENGTIFLSGTARDIRSSNRAVQVASAFGKVVNLLNVEVPAAEPQILLKVIFASVDRSLSTQLGMNLFTNGLGNTIAGASTGQFAPPTLTLPSGTTPATAILSNELNLFAFYPGLKLGATIQALESKGLVQVLAEPNVLAENGKQASFLAGGEYPYPVVQGASGSGSGPTVTIQFKEYGIRLNFIPTITPRGTIHLQVAPEVSALDFTNALEVSGFAVPAIDVRKVNTEVELGEGQSFAIGGLLDDRETQTLQKIPFLADIPVLGKFFKSISKNKTNTELIVIVTPEIVFPIPVGGTLPHLNYPEKFLPSNSGTQMNIPDSNPARTLAAPPPATIPVEQLIDSMKPEKPLLIDNSSSGASGASGSGSGGGSASSAPQ